MASSVAGVIEPALQAAETARSAGRPTTDLTAYDLYLRAYAMVLSSAGQIPEALRLMEQAIARDPRYGPALAWAAFCCYRLLLDGRSEDPEADRLKGTDFAQASPGSGRRRPGRPGECRRRAGLFRRGHRRDDGVGRSCAGAQPEFRPRLAHQRHAQTLGGPARHRDRACRELRCASAPAPASARRSLNRRRAFLSRRFDEAVPKLLLAIQEDPGLPEPYRFLAACYAHMGRLDEAREIVARLRAITSVVIPDVELSAEPRAPRAFLVGPAPRGGRDDMSQTRRLAAILAAESPSSESAAYCSLG